MPCKVAFSFFSSFFFVVDIKNLAQQKKMQKIICFPLQKKYLFWPVQEMALKEHNTHVPSFSALLLWCIVSCLPHHYRLIQHNSQPHKADLLPGSARGGGEFCCSLSEAPHFSCKKRCCYLHWCMCLHIIILNAGQNHTHTKKTPNNLRDLQFKQKQVFFV